MKVPKLKLILALAMMLVSLTPAQAFADAPSAAGSAEVSHEQCFRGNYKRNINALAGNTVATATLVGRWCVDEGKVTEAGVLASWSETQTPFWMIVREQNPHEGAKVVDNEARIFKQFAFRMALETPWFILDKPHYSCSRITATATGGAIGESECTAY